MQYAGKNAPTHVVGGAEADPLLQRGSQKLGHRLLVEP